MNTPALVGDMYQDEHGEVYVYTGSEWRRVVTPEKQWNDLTYEEKAEIVSAHYPSVYRIIDAAIAAFKEKNLIK